MDKTLISRAAAATRTRAKNREQTAKTARQQIEDLKLREYVGGSLAIARSSLGLRQADLIRQYPQYLTTRSKLTGYESGDRMVSPAFLMALCRDYGFSMDWFYFRKLNGLTVDLAKLLAKNSQ
jgi:hypothetical protein